jgi:Flp pilus assembly protein TadG
MTTTDQSGSAAVELALITPLLVVLLLFVVALGRLSTARAEVDAAARDGARAASLARSAATSRINADDAVRASLAGSHTTCHGLAVTTDTARFTPGGVVTANVTCTIPLADLALLALPGQRTITARFAAPIDRYRGA